MNSQRPIPGVVDDHVGDRARGLDRFGGGYERFEIREIDRKDLGLPSIALDRVGHLAQLLLGAGEQKYASPTGRDRPSGCRSKPLRGPGDQRRLASKFHAVARAYLRPPAAEFPKADLQATLAEGPA